MPWPQLAKPPIVEALIDIRVDLPERVDLPVLASLHDRIRENYPERREHATWKAQVELGEGMRLHQQSGGADGYLFSSADGRQVFQARLDGFTFSRLRPYEDWSTLCEKAVKLWGLYCSVANPKSVSRLAVRYINRLELEGRAEEDLSQWIRTAPSVAPGLPRRMESFFLRLVMPFEDSGATAIVTQAREEGPAEGQRPMLFDIDVFFDKSLDPQDPGLWPRLEELRDVKNKVFFSSLTPRCLDLYR